MKNRFKSFIAAGSFSKLTMAFLLGLAACQQDNVTPEEPADVASKSMREGIVATIPKYYQLTKVGLVSLSYFEDGRLKKSTYNAGSRGGVPASYSTYKYTAHSIVETVYYKGKVASEIIYTLDAVTGYCSESNQTDYIPYGPNAYVEEQTSTAYTYNAKGQILTRTNKKSPTEKSSFVFDAAGDLVKIKNYSKNSLLEREYTLYYDQPTGDPILPNLTPIANDLLNLPDQFLPIFGKPSKHLVKMTTDNKSLDGIYYNYLLNADGYPTTRQAYSLTGAALVETLVYDYLVTKIGFNL